MGRVLVRRLVHALRAYVMGCVLIRTLGVTFLFRAGLAIFSCARRVFLQSASPDAVLDALSRPPPNVLPPNPDAFIELAFSMKLKDDDIRKQRNKLEAQVKRRTAQTRASPISPATPQTISLPKNGI